MRLSPGAFRRSILLSWSWDGRFALFKDGDLIELRYCCPVFFSFCAVENGEGVHGYWRGLVRVVVVFLRSLSALQSTRFEWFSLMEYSYLNICVMRCAPCIAV